MSKYLDSTGLAYFWSKIKAYGDAHWGGSGGGSVLDFYPVGSYYETSDSNFDPNLEWGGTWVEDSKGRVTVAQDSNDSIFGTVGDTGGSKYIQAHTHGFTNPTVPDHTHSVSAVSITSSGAHVHTLNLRNAGTTGSRATNNVTYGASGHDYQNSNPFVSSGSHTHSVPAHNTTSSGTCTTTGGGVGAINTSGLSTGNQGNMPPYIVVYRWHRTA